MILARGREREVVYWQQQQGVLVRSVDCDTILPHQWPARQSSHRQCLTRNSLSEKVLCYVFGTRRLHVTLNSILIVQNRFCRTKKHQVVTPFIFSRRTHNPEHFPFSLHLLINLLQHHGQLYGPSQSLHGSLYGNGHNSGSCPQIRLRLPSRTPPTNLNQGKLDTLPFSVRNRGQGKLWNPVQVQTAWKPLETLCRFSYIPTYCSTVLHTINWTPILWQALMYCNLPSSRRYGTIGTGGSSLVARICATSTKSRDITGGTSYSVTD